jgi:hypothetical protein
MARYERRWPMRIEDVPPGLLVIAVRIEGRVYCLECRQTGVGEALTEKEIAAESEQNGGVCCADCGFAFFDEPSTMYWGMVWG